VFVRSDLSIPQLTVQSCHAVIEASNAFNFSSLPVHPSVIVLGIKNEQKLHRVRRYLIDQDIKHAHFYEPDIGHELTALATEPLYDDRRSLLRKYQLLQAATTKEVANA
jgi:hypothetical protein